MLQSTADVTRVRTIQEALTCKAEKPESMFLAGGTDLMVAIELEAARPTHVIDLWDVDEMRGIREESGLVVVGALTTYTDLAASDLLKKHAPALLDAAQTVGAMQIQNRGTLGGNVANASPAGDTLPVLLALDVEVEVASSERGSRRIPMNQLYTGYRELAIKPDEMITRFWFPQRHVNDRTHFRKVGTRQAQAISKVVFAGRLRVENGAVEEARIAFGSVAATPVRCWNTERALLGKAVNVEAVEELSRDITPIDDIRSNAKYRLTVAKRTLKTWLASEMS